MKIPNNSPSNDRTETYNFFLEQIYQQKTDKLKNYTNLVACNHYEIWYNYVKKRLYLKLKDIWIDSDISCNFQKEITNLDSFLLKNNLETLILDVIHLGLGHSFECKKSQINMKKMLSEKIITASCMLISSKNINDVLYSDVQNKEIGLKINALFHNFDTADNWLDTNF